MFQKAVRKKVKLKIAVTGPSGSGKTYSSLLLAKGLGKKIAVIDTENGSASLYAEKFNFDTVNLSPPFTTEKYLETVAFAVKSGYDVLVIDSITHGWAGEGGLLEQKEQLDSRGKTNSFTNWSAITKKHEWFKSALLQSDIHIVATMRSKQEYVLSENDKGKQAPKKVGMAPIQRDGIEYEFTTVFDIAMNHEAESSKDRTGLFADKIFKITEDTGLIFMKWLDGGADPKLTLPETAPPPASTIGYRIPSGSYKGKSIDELYAELGVEGVQKYIQDVNSVVQKTGKGGAVSQKLFEECMNYEAENEELPSEKNLDDFLNEVPKDNPPAALDKRIVFVTGTETPPPKKTVPNFAPNAGVQKP